MSGERPGEAAAAEAVAAAFEPWSEESSRIAREQAELVVAAAYPVIAEAVRAEERERVLGTFRALIADEKALDDESFFYASLFVTEAAARLARDSSS